MTSISQKEVEHIAQLARLDLTEEEKVRFTQQLSQILSYVHQLQGVQTEGIPLTSSIAKDEPVLREDIHQKCLSLEQVLANAPESSDGFFVVPNILGK